MPKVFHKLNFSTSPENTIKYLKDKNVELSFDYKDIQKEAHHKAFTVAKISKLDLLEDIQKSLVSSLKDGKSFDKWKREIKQTLIKKGWYGKQEAINPNTGEIKEFYIGSRRLRVIFHTNTRMAYAVGSANNIYSSTNEFIQYKSLLYGNNRRIDHKALHNMVKHRNDKFWATYYPPNGFGCECYVISLSKKDLERLGLVLDTKDYTGHIKNDFAYDVRHLSIESLENAYYLQALKFNSDNIINKALDDISSFDRLKNYQEFVDEVSKDKSYYKNIIPAGIISFEVFNFLKTKNLIPITPHIFLDKKALTHMQREVKIKKETALSLEDIRNIPITLNNPDMILYDTVHQNILYIFNDYLDKDIKIVIEINYISKTQEYNRIVTTGKVQSSNIIGNIKSGIYILIKKR